MGNKQSQVFDNEVFVVGNNRDYQLGLKHCKNLDELVSFNRYNKTIEIKSIHCGISYTFIHTTDNKYFFVGMNNIGQSGIGIRAAYFTFCREMSYFKESKIGIKNLYTSHSGQHIIWQSMNNKLYANGNNCHNQCGIDKVDVKKGIYSPTLIDNAPVCIRNIAMGPNHTIILADNIIVENIEHIVSFYTRNSTQIIPYDIIMLICDYYIIKGIVYSTKYKGAYHAGTGANGNGAGIDNFSEHGYDGFHQIPFFADKTIKHIAAGTDTSIFVDTNDILWCDGVNLHGQLGLGSLFFGTVNPTKNDYFYVNKIKIKEICSGSRHSLVLGNNGICYAFGDNRDGQCAQMKLCTVKTPTPIDLPTECKIVRIKAGNDHNYMMSENMEHFLFGHNDNNQCTLTKVDKGRILSPFCINDIFNKLTSNKKTIKDIHIGNGNTWIFSRCNT